MKTESLRTNQLSPGAYQQYLAYLQAMDAKDIEAYSAFLAEDCSLQMNNDPAITGKAAIVAKLTPYWKSFQNIEHELLNIYGTDSSYVLEALNHYRRLDGRPLTVRAVAFTDLNQAKQVTSVRLYTDVSSLFS